MNTDANTHATTGANTGMNPDPQRAACDLLYSHWMAQTQLDELPPALRPSTRGDGYAIQAHFDAHSDLPLFGWKIAATSTAGQAHVQVDGPLAGRLLAERVIPDGGESTFGHGHMGVAELEFAFRMGGRFEPRQQPYEVAEVLAGIETLHPAIELPDSRFNQFERVGAAQLIADNACADKFILGPAADESWRDLNLAEHTLRAQINGRHVADGIGANVLGDPRTALTWLVNELSRHGIMLGAGQVVTTGTCVVPVPIAAGMHIFGDFGSVGQVSVSIV